MTAFAVDNHRLNAEERLGCRARLGRDGARKRGDENAAGFGLPPRVDNRTAFVADHAVIPQPRFGIDRLADAAEEPQTLAAGLLHRLLALAHQRPNGRWRRLENVDLVLVHYLPEPGEVRVGGDGC